VNVRTLVVAWVLAGASLVSVAQGPHELTASEKAKVDGIIAKMTLEEKIDYIGGTGFAVRAMPRLQLPSLEMSDGPLGVRSNHGVPSTTYAGGIALTASWDRSLASAVGGGIGRDACARGVMYMLGPAVNIYRSPRDGRNFEYMGEDPYLAGQMATGYIEGMQAQGVSATVKHYAANNSEFLRHDSDSVIGERALREIYLPAFEAAVRQGHVGAVMNSYNLVNGVHATQNPFLNIQVLRKEWGFPGTLMSDWNASYDGVAEANNGLDLEMPTGKFMNKASLLPAVKSGAVKEATIDEKVRHILTTAMMFGWLDRPQQDTSIKLDDPQDNAVALRSARESVTLLKNEGALLPLDKAHVKTVLVVGRNADPGAPIGGGSAAVKPVHTISLLEGLKMVAPGVHVDYEAGLPSLSELANQTTFMTAKAAGKPGVTVEVFDGKDLAGKPEISTADHINIAHGMKGDPTDGAGKKGVPVRSRRITGYYDASTTGDYLIAMAGSTEGSGERLLIDGKLVVDDWKYKSAAEPHLTMHLTAGMHQVIAESWRIRANGGRIRVGICRASDVVSQRAKELAAKADVVIVAAGFQGDPSDNENEREGSDRTFTLPSGQDELISAMVAANPKTIVDVTSGGNVDSRTWFSSVPVWVQQWYGGQAEGQALVEVLFGDTNPSGHLPATFERSAQDNPTYNNYYPVDDKERVIYKEGIFVGYRGYEKNGVKPLFPFGYGLSYTTFTFGHLKIVPGSGATATVEFQVTNTGKRAGAEVAQVYVGENASKVERPKHELKGFARVELAPGEMKTVSVPLDARSFAYWSEAKHGWTIDPGTFTISVGDSVESLPLTGAFHMPASATRDASF
jgi:beta-glucosidase